MRGVTARIVFSILTAILLAVQFPVSAEPFASAPGTQALSPGTQALSADSPTTYAADLRGQGATQAGQLYSPCGPPAQEGDPNGLLRTRDRHRAAAQSTPEPPSRCLMTGDTPCPAPAAALVAPAGPHRTSRPSASHSPAVLQVFRC
ncbi:hypothetical protein AB0H45_27545 [Streptomyces atroolivaceus]|uniref:Secreted protein n=1 Tax=Streptomyces atroolivaceus TaxID=66869 RepID=A0ABV9VEV6_STRAZ|nr:hypothetical protein [Streptomyces atroolivaceus]